MTGSHLMSFGRCKGTLLGWACLVLTCPSLVIDTIAAFSGVVEMNVPYKSGGRGFPTNCTGTNVR